MLKLSMNTNATVPAPAIADAERDSFSALASTYAAGGIASRPATVTSLNATP